MASAIRDDNPVLFFHHYLLTLEHGEVPEGEHVVPFGRGGGRARGRRRDARGHRLDGRPQALAAAERLAGEGIEAEVIDPRTLAPLDLDTILESVEKTGRLVLVDQAPRHGSASAVIAADVADARLLLAEGADQAGHGAGRDDPLQRAAGGVRAARRGQDRRRRALGARDRRPRGDASTARANGARAAAHDVAHPALRGARRRAQAPRRGLRARSTRASGRRASRPASARSCATTTRSTSATARTGTRSPRARRWNG